MFTVRIWFHVLHRLVLINVFSLRPAGRSHFQRSIWTFCIKTLGNTSRKSILLWFKWQIRGLVHNLLNSCCWRSARRTVRDIKVKKKSIRKRCDKCSAHNGSLYHAPLKNLVDDYAILLTVSSKKWLKSCPKILMIVMKFSFRCTITTYGRRSG